MNEFNILKSINKLLRDNFSQLKYVEIISPNKKIDRNYFLKKDEDLHNKSETTIYPLVYSFCGRNIDKIDGIKRDGVSDATLMKNDLYIHLLILSGRMVDYLSLADNIKEFLMSYKIGGGYYLPVDDFQSGGDTCYGYISGDITITPFSEIAKNNIDQKYIKLVKEMVFPFSLHKEY